MVNLAGSYDFTSREHPQDARANVHGPRNMLELARELAIRRLLFAGSLAACPLGAVVTEAAPPDADIPCAPSKRAGEDLVREYSRRFPAIIRIAAVFGDWCEYPPLYTLLGNRCSGPWLRSRIIAGQGRSATPSIHVHDPVLRLLGMIDKSEALDRLRAFNTGPDGAVPRLELFRIGVRFYRNRTPRPLHVGKGLPAPLILARMPFAHLQGQESFEQRWMLRCGDRQLIAPSSPRRYREILGQSVGRGMTAGVEKATRGRWRAGLAKL